MSDDPRWDIAFAILTGFVVGVVVGLLVGTIR